MLYYLAIRALIKKDPHLRKCLTKCQHCGILFFTHARNAGRQDIRCPFGCRQAHKKESSNKRNKAYYQTDDAKDKKKKLNERRRKSEKNKPEKAKQELETVDEDQIDQDLLIHLQLVARHIERRRIELEAIRIMVKTLLRQHSIDILKKRVYGCSNFFKPPP